VPSVCKSIRHSGAGIVVFAHILKFCMSFDLRGVILILKTHQGPCFDDNFSSSYADHDPQASSLVVEVIREQNRGNQGTELICQQSRAGSLSLLSCGTTSIVK